MTALLPCPFCGKEPTSRYVGDEDGGYHEVACYAPHTTHAPYLFCGVHAGGEAEAITAWNRRPPSPVGRDLGSPSGLGGLGETPSDVDSGWRESALAHLAKVRVDHPDESKWVPTLRWLSQALAAPPSPWRSMESRRETLEEAAKVADAYTDSSDRSVIVAAGWIADDIRALKPLPSPPSEGEK